MATQAFPQPSSYLAASILRQFFFEKNIKVGMRLRRSVN